MSITPVASTALESPTSDSGNDAPASGFDRLLASAEGPASKPGTGRSDRVRDPRVAAETDPSIDRPGDKTTTDKSAPAKSDDANDDTTGLLAPLAPAVTAPTPSPTAVPALDVTANAAPAETPNDPAAIAPIVVTAPTAEMIDATVTDPTATGPAATTDPAEPGGGTPKPVTGLTHVTPEPTPGVPGPPGAPPRVGNPNEKNAPGPPAHANAVFNRATDDASATPDPAPAPAPSANADATATAAARAALANAPGLATTDHIRVPAANTPARPDGPSTNALDATSPTPPASAPTANTAGVEVVTATPAAAPPPPAEQLVSVLKPMRENPNGSYTLHLELKPPELGRIELRVEMRDGVMHASIHSDREGSAQMLRDALSELRDRLDAASVRTGSLSVSDGSVGGHDRNGANANGPTGASASDDITNANDPVAAPNTAGTDLESEATSLLDVRV
jgi:hypothetical protein